MVLTFFLKTNSHGGVVIENKSGSSNITKSLSMCVCFFEKQHGGG
jgi:hypothetical protein